MEQNIKDYREKELKCYILGNALLLLMTSGVFDVIHKAVSIDLSDQTLASLILQIVGSSVLTGLIVSIMYTYVFLLDAVIPPNWKDWICGLGNKRPAMTIFDDIREDRHFVLTDSRFTRKQVLERYGTIYKELQEITDTKERYRKENGNWYILYRKHKDEKMISVANRDYLLCRDLCVSNLYIMAGYLLLSGTGFLSLDRSAVFFIIGEYILTSCATRTKSRRFVCNVIAADVNEKQEDEREKV